VIRGIFQPCVEASGYLGRQSLSTTPQYMLATNPPSLAIAEMYFRSIHVFAGFYFAECASHKREFLCIMESDTLRACVILSYSLIVSVRG